MDLKDILNLFCSSDENDPTLWFTQARFGKQQSDASKFNLAGIACWASFAVWKSIAGGCPPYHRHAFNPTRGVLSEARVWGTW
jgi:hypothetical protein